VWRYNDRHFGSICRLQKPSAVHLASHLCPPTTEQPMTTLAGKGVCKIHRKTRGHMTPARKMQVIVAAPVGCRVAPQNMLR
jgi:hypothetical protein